MLAFMDAMRCALRDRKSGSWMGGLSMVCMSVHVEALPLSLRREAKG